MDQIWHCPICREEYPADRVFCPEHSVELEPVPSVETESDLRGEPVEHPRTVCWRCGHRSENQRNTHCEKCKESLIPPALVVKFPHGLVVLRRDETVALGRLGRHGHVFARYPNVSRRHAVVRVDEEGKAWIDPEQAAPNGTFVNDIEIDKSTSLASGDEVRFAAKTNGAVGAVSRPAYD